MSAIATELSNRLRSAFPDSEVLVKDLTGTGDHFEARVVSPRFRGKTMREQHQLVFRELESFLSQSALHALALVTQPAA